MPDSAPNFSDIALAKKRLARVLGTLVIVRIVYLCFVTLGFLEAMSVLPFSSDDFIGTGVLLGLFAAVGAEFGGSHALCRSKILPTWIRIYGAGFFLLFSLWVLLLWLTLSPYVFVAIVLLPLYGLIPQFFISRWLAKTAEEALFSATDNTDNHG
jgi:hypothetical protein